MEQSRKRVIERARRSPDDVEAGDVETLVASLDAEDRTISRSAAIALARVSEESPALLGNHVTALQPHLGRDDPQIRGMIVRAIADVAAVSPDDAVPAAPALGACLDIEYDVTEATALTALVHVVREDPTAGRELVSALEAVIDGDSNVEAATSRALLALLQILPVATDDVADVVPSLLELLATVPVAGRPDQRVEAELGEFAEAAYEELAVERASARKLASVLLARIAERRPENVVPHADELAGYLSDRDRLVRKAVVDAVRPIATARPSAVEPALDALFDAFVDADDEETRGHVAQTLGLVADEFPERFAAESDRIVPPSRDLLDSESVDARAGAAGLLAALAATDPDAVESAVPDLRRRLEDDDDGVRGQAVWALREAGAVAASSDLQRLSETDPDPDVRALASETLTEFDSE